MEAQYRTCKNCQEEFIGRRDKMFCSNKCKSAYHNEHDPKKRAFRSFCKKENEIRIGFKKLKLIIQTDLEQTNRKKCFIKGDTGQDMDLDLAILKNYDLLSEIRKIEGLLYN